MSARLARKKWSVVDGWMEVKARLRIAYSNQQKQQNNKTKQTTKQQTHGDSNLYRLKYFVSAPGWLAIE